MSVVETMAPVVKRVRAYFAPVDRAAGVPVMFDAATQGGFDLDAPPGPWVDLGWIEGFARQCGTKVEAVRSGAPAVTQTQVRTEIEATVSLGFESWGKLPLALAAGSQQMNLLSGPAGVALQAGSNAGSLVVGASAAAGFAVGSLVAVDVDYAGQTGFVGSGVSGAFVKTALGESLVATEYVRRVTLNVGRVTAISAGALTLEQPLLAGVPGAGMKVSAVTGFCDREGSSFFQEWSGLFVAEGQQGERVLWHYPRLQAMSGAAELPAGSAGGFERLRLRGAFRALPVRDPVDGETVVCWRSFVAG